MAVYGEGTICGNLKSENLESGSEEQSDDKTGRGADRINADGDHL